MTALLAMIPRWLLIAATAALLALTGVQYIELVGVRSDRDTARTEVSTLRTAIADANTRAARQAADLSATVLKAQNEAKIREAALRGAAAAAATQSDGLRDDLAAERLRYDQLSRDAVVERAAATSNVLADCSRRYQGMAAIADRHASDVKTLIEAWPKSPPAGLGR
jgi:hypothetical protein